MLVGAPFDPGVRESAVEPSSVICGQGQAVVLGVARAEHRRYGQPAAEQIRGRRRKHGQQLLDRRGDNRRRLGCPQLVRVVQQEARGVADRDICPELWVLPRACGQRFVQQ